MFKFFRDVKLGQQHLSSKFVGLAFVYNFLRAVDRLRQIRKQLLHLLGAFEVELIVGKAKSKFAASLAYILFRLLQELPIFDTK